MTVRCINCGFPCKKYGKTSADKQRWYCNQCKVTFTHPIDNTAKQFNQFLHWLFSKGIQKEMPGEGRTFRRHSLKFWEIWPMPPKIESPRDVLFVDGIYLSRKACILICYDGTHVLGWYICRSENSRAWEALLQRIAAPKVVVSDGGSGFKKALRMVWRSTKLQRCTFHAFCQVRRYTTRHPKTLAGIVLYQLGLDLLQINTKIEAQTWTQRLLQWRVTFKAFLSEMTRDSKGNLHSTHERLLKAYNSLIRLINSNTLFVYLEDLNLDRACPSNNNPIEGGVNAQLRTLLRDHRGMSIERRIKAVCWWCYVHSPQPLSASEILAIMPTDQSISKIYNYMTEQAQLEGVIPTWGDAIAWSDLHNYDKSPFKEWD